MVEGIDLFVDTFYLVDLVISACTSMPLTYTLVISVDLFGSIAPILNALVNTVHLMTSTGTQTTSDRGFPLLYLKETVPPRPLTHKPFIRINLT